MDYRIEKKEPELTEIIAACFPEYNGRKITLRTDPPEKIPHMGDGGRVCTYMLYDKCSGEAQEIKQYSHKVYSHIDPEAHLEIPSGNVLLNRYSFLGHDMGIEVFVAEEEMQRRLEPYEELPPEEMVVLHYTSKYQASGYRAKDLRFHEANDDTGIDRETWDAAKESLIGKKILTKRGAIKPRGMNILTKFGPRNCSVGGECDFLEQIGYPMR